MALVLTRRLQPVRGLIDLTPVVNALDRGTNATTDGDKAIANAIANLVGPPPNVKAQLDAFVNYEVDSGRLTGEEGKLVAYVGPPQNPGP